MKQWICVAVAIASLAVALPGAAQGETYEAVIAVDSVPVRSGAGRAYYEVGQLQKGARVTVEDELFGWYKIRCPQGVYSYVERKNVDAKGDGSRGVVNTDRTAVNAAHATKGPADSYRKMLDLNSGDEVRIIETVDNAYRIEPPAGAFVFLPPDSVTRADQAPPETPAPVTPAPEAPEAPEAAQPPTTPTPAPRPESPAPAAPPAPLPPVEPPTPPVPPTPPTPPAPPAPPTPSDLPATPEATGGATPDPGSLSDPASPTGPDAAAVNEFDPDPTTPVPAAADDLLTDPTVAVDLPNVPVSTQASNELLVAVEVAMLPYFTLPVDEQPIAKMTQGYADASQLPGLSDNDRAIIRGRLAELERNRELALALREVDKAESEVADASPPATSGTPGSTPGSAPGSTPGNPENASESAPGIAPDRPESPENAPASPGNAPAAPPAAPPVAGYDAVGILTASTVHTGANQPELLRLLDPTGRRTVAYLEPGGEVDTVRMLGRLVGIVGTTSYDPTTKLRLIQPRRIDILSPQ